MKARKYRARLSDKYFVSEDEKYLLVHLELIEPDRIEYTAGQYVSLKVSEKGERRSYSIASTPDMNHGIILVAEMIPGGLGSKYLKDIKIGDEVEILGPLGRFTVTSDSKLLFVATGSGIVPVKAMIEDLLINKKETKPIRLHWGMRNETSMFWFDNFERLAEEHPNFVFDQVLSKPSENWDLCTGHVQDCLIRDFGESGLSEWEGFVCGSPTSVKSIIDKLQELKMIKEKIHHEKFS